MCETGQFIVQSTLKCNASACALPALPPNATYGDCPTSGVLSSSQSCNVACKDGYDTAGATLYACANGTLTANASLKCNPRPCELPEQYGWRDKTCGGSPVPSGTTCEVYDDMRWVLGSSTAFVSKV